MKNFLVDLTYTLVILAGIVVLVSFVHIIFDKYDKQKETQEWCQKHPDKALEHKECF